MNLKTAKTLSKTKTTDSFSSLKQLLAGAWSGFVEQRRVLIGIGFTALLINIFIVTTAIDAEFVKALWFALFVAPAFIWASTQPRNKQPVSVKAAYYESAAASVRFFLVILLFLLMSLPLLLGGALFTAAHFGVSGSTLESLVVFAIWVGLAIPSVIWLTRYSFAQIEVVRNGLMPFAALRKSHARTKGKIRPLFVRLGLLVGLQLLALGILILILSALSLPEIWVSFAAEALVFLLVLPVSYSYLNQLYKEL